MNPDDPLLYRCTIPSIKSIHSQLQDEYLGQPTNVTYEKGTAVELDHQFAAETILTEVRQHASKIPTFLRVFFLSNYSVQRKVANPSYVLYSTRKFGLRIALV